MADHHDWCSHHLRAMSLQRVNSLMNEATITGDCEFRFGLGFRDVLSINLGV
jgi:hypothetical protein